MIRLLESVPWFVIAAFTASGVLAVAAGRGQNGPETSRRLTRAVGLTYAAVATLIVALWAREQF